jgi:hypothetical protein
MTTDTLKGAREILRILHEKFPPEAPRKHSLTLEEGRLRLQISFPGEWRSVLFDEKDLEQTPETLVSEIVKVLVAAELGATP